MKTIKNFLSKKIILTAFGLLFIVFSQCSYAVYFKLLLDTNDPENYGVIQYNANEVTWDIAQKLIELLQNSNVVEMYIQTPKDFDPRTDASKLNPFSNPLNFQQGTLKAISEAIAKNNTLRTLGLVGYHFNKEQAVIISDALKKNDSIEHLDLNGTFFGNNIGTTVEIITEILFKNKRINTLDLWVDLNLAYVRDDKIFEGFKFERFKVGEKSGPIFLKNR
jgi:hypothetical protein